MFYTKLLHICIKSGSSRIKVLVLRVVISLLYYKTSKN